MSGWALFSDDHQYRYTLGRSWNPEGDRRLVWVMLNPSTADSSKDDQTVRRCVHFSRAAGFDELVIVNLFALITSDPSGLLDAADPSGPDNDRHRIEALVRADAVAFAWGAIVEKVTGRPRSGFADSRGRAFISRPYVEQIVKDLDKPTLYLGFTAGGHPRHPARMGDAHRLMEYS